MAATTHSLLTPAASAPATADGGAADELNDADTAGGVLYGGGGGLGGGEIQLEKHARVRCSAAVLTPAARISREWDSRQEATRVGLPATPVACRDVAAEAVVLSGNHHHKRRTAPDVEAV